MKILAGNFKGRRFEAPHGHRAHPMSEQIRNALFNALGDVKNKSVLDAYAGSGAVAFEAASRGAEPVFAVEKDARVFKTMKTNRDNLEIEPLVQVSRANISSWLEKTTRNFNVIVADPPFDQLSEEHLAKLATRLEDGGVLAISHSSDIGVQVEGLTNISSNEFGNAKLSFFTK